MPSLILLRSPEAASLNAHFPLTEDLYVIGRDADVCQIVIPHHAVSRKHAQITRSNGQFYIEDLKSRNKTFVNSKEVPPPVRQPLRPDDRIKICDFLFRFHDARAVERLRGEMPSAWLDGHAPATRPTPIQSGWPVEHPLDFDWRFTPEAAQLLLNRCPAGGAVAFLGAPSLAREAAARGRRSGVTLLDRNPAIIEAVRSTCEGFTSVCADLVWGEPVGNGQAAITVADPPWYPEHTTAFLWAASRLSRLGARVLLSLPPEGTRPGILAEREAVFGSATSFGLRLESVERGVLAYRMPLFERNALAAAGVPAVSADWRRGDLASFVVNEKNSVSRPPFLGGPDGWEEESFGAVRIKCRTSSGGQFQDPTLSHVVPGDMLTTVSRRHPARSEVDVWTSGNRVFRCSAPGLFRVIVSALSRRDDAERSVAAAIRRELTAPEAALVRGAAAQATDLIRREARELAEYGHQCQERDLAEAV